MSIVVTFFDRTIGHFLIGKKVGYIKREIKAMERVFEQRKKSKSSVVQKQNRLFIGLNQFIYWVGLGWAVQEAIHADTYNFSPLMNTRYDVKKPPNDLLIIK